MRTLGKLGPLLLFTVSVGAFCLLTSCGCGTAVKDFRIIRAQLSNLIRESAGSSVWICPGESVTLGWTTENADTAEIDNGVGAVPAVGGVVTVTPTQDTHYKILAKKGDCKDSKTVDVYVVGANSELSVTASHVLGERETFTWEARLLPQFYSPNIVATAGWLTAPATQAGWSARATDINGSLHNVPLPPAKTGFGGPVPVAGTWDLGPNQPNEVASSTPSAAQFVLAIRCK